MGRIVVGVDGSEGSRAALRWAAAEARARDARLEVVHVYDYRPPYEIYPYSTGLTHRDEDIEQVARHARLLVENLAASVRSEAKAVAVVLRDRRPARALIQQAKNADLLVLGSRGRGGAAGLILGSVSQQCVHRALCPVAIVPAQTGARRRAA